MVFTKLLFNNLKEYTPKFIKTIPYNKTVKPQFYKGLNPAFRFNQTRSVINIYKFINRFFYGSLAGQTLLMFIVSSGFTLIFWRPVLYVYQSTNSHRQLSVALKKEKEYIRQQELLEEAEEDEDDDEDDEEEEDDE